MLVLTNRVVFEVRLYEKEMSIFINRLVSKQERGRETYFKDWHVDQLVERFVIRFDRCSDQSFRIFSLQMDKLHIRSFRSSVDK